MRCDVLMSSLACALMLLACAPTTAQQPTAGPEAAHGGQGQVVESPQGKPASADVLRGRLKARHVEDLPTAQELKKHRDAQAALIWIAGNDDAMVVRVRALSLLRHFPTDEAFEALAQRAGAQKIHPTLRAAAMRGLEGQTARPQAQALLKDALRHKDRRVAMAAAKALATDPGCASLLAEAAADPLVHEAVRKKLQQEAP